MAEYLTLRVSPELAGLLRRPGGYRSQGRVTFWLDQDHVMNVRELTEADDMAEMLWGDRDGTEIGTWHEQYDGGDDGG